MIAEQFYFFRHSILRDAAYELQIPSHRRELHQQAFHALEALVGRPPELPPLDHSSPIAPAPHPANSHAMDMAGHLRTAEAGAELLMPWLRLAAEQADAACHYDGARALWLEFADLCADDIRPYALRRAGLTALRSGRLPDAATHFEQGVEAAARLGDAPGEAACLAGLCGVLTNTGRAAEAEAAIVKSIELCRHAGDARSEVIGQIVLANLCLMIGRTEEAAARCADAVAVAQQVGDRRNECAGRINRAAALLDLDDSDAAADEIRRALLISNELDDHTLKLGAIGNLAALHSTRHETTEAIRLYHEAIALARLKGDRVTEAISVNNVAAIHHKERRLDTATEWFTHALDLARETGHRTLEMSVLLAMSGVCSTLEKPEPLLRYAEAALAIALAVESQRHVGIALAWRAVGRAATAQTEAARADWHEATARFADVGHPENPTFIAMRKACARAGIPALDDPPV